MAKVWVRLPLGVLDSAATTQTKTRFVVRGACTGRLMAKDSTVVGWECESDSRPVLFSRTRFAVVMNLVAPRPLLLIETTVPTQKLANCSLVERLALDLKLGFESRFSKTLLRLARSSGCGEAWYPVSFGN